MNVTAIIIILGNTSHYNNNPPRPSNLVGNHLLHLLVSAEVMRSK